MWKDLHQKGEIHQIVYPLECRTAVIFPALIPTLDAFQTSGGIKFVNMDRRICVANNAMSTI
jgi:hypothetical protein